MSQLRMYMLTLFYLVMTHDVYGFFIEFLRIFFHSNIPFIYVFKKNLCCYHYPPNSFPFYAKIFCSESEKNLYIFTILGLDDKSINFRFGSDPFFKKKRTEQLSCPSINLNYVSRDELPIRPSLNGYIAVQLVVKLVTCFSYDMMISLDC